MICTQSVFDDSGIVSTADPQLGPLQDNGGLTPTMALLDDSTGISPAIDAGTSAGAPGTDRRGFKRDAYPDIGAFEYHLVATMIVNTAAHTGPERGPVLRNRLIGWQRPLCREQHVSAWLARA